jgi:SSS family solute:Na+ symporter
MPTLQLLDWVIIVVYFVAVLGIAWWSTTRGDTRETSAGYFLAGRHAGWWVIGASLFAANIGSEHLVGLAGTGAASGVAVGHFEVAASWILLVLGWVFVPFYLRNGVFTMPEFLERRYSPAARWYLALISIAGYVLTKISVTIAAGGIVFETIMGIDFWTGALVVVVATGLYTVLGGLRAVLYTDFMQIFVIFAGSLSVTLFGLQELGGWSEMREVVGPSFMNMWKPATDPDFPWTGILFGVPILGVWYWCTDQFIVQRVLSAKGIDHARGGTIFGGFLKILPLFLFVIPGVIAYALAQKGRIELGTPDEALPTLIVALLPIGFRGLVVAGLLAALTSSLASVFNSCSTLITMDVYRKLHPGAAEKTLVRVGQGATVVLVGLGLAWIPLMKLISGQLYQYLQSVQAYIAPPITAVFVLGIAWRRVNAPGALAALGTGFVLGTARLVLELNKEWSWLRDGWLLDLVSMNFLHFAILLFVVCCAVLVGVSLATVPPRPEQVNGLTFGGDAGAAEPRSRHFALTVWLSLALLATVAAVWLTFRG